jgi:DNA anti-recombination protein RmuC
MHKLMLKKEELEKELKDIQTRYNNLAGNLRVLETRMVEIQGALKMIEDMIQEDEK